MVYAMLRSFYLGCVCVYPYVCTYVRVHVWIVSIYPSLVSYQI